MLENDDSIQLAGNSISQIRFIGFNLTREPFTDVRVRQAVSMAVDRGPIIEAALFGYGTPVDIIFTQDPTGPRCRGPRSHRRTSKGP